MGKGRQVQSWSWELMKGAWVKVAARLFFHHLVLLWSSHWSSAGTSQISLSADPHITHSCLNTREAEMGKMDTKTSRKTKIGCVGWERIRITEHTFRVKLSSDPAGRVCAHMERSYLEVWASPELNTWHTSLQWFESGEGSRSWASTPGKVKEPWLSTCCW